MRTAQAERSSEFGNNRRDLIRQLISLLHAQYKLFEGDLVLALLFEGHRERFAQNLKGSISEVIDLSEKIYPDLKWRPLKNSLTTAKNLWDFLMLLRESRTRIFSLLESETDYIPKDETKKGSTLVCWRNVPGAVGLIIFGFNLLLMFGGTKIDSLLTSWIIGALLVLMSLSPKLAAKVLSKYAPRS